MISAEAYGVHRPIAPYSNHSGAGKRFCQQYQPLTSELAGMDEKNIDLQIANGVLTIRGEKQDEKEEKKKDYYMRERSYGSFERTFEVPEGVDTDKIEAAFKKGVLTVTLPKKAEAQKPAKKIEVKAA